MALTIEQRLDALEAKNASVPDPPPYVEVATAIVTIGDTTITATRGTKADLLALIESKTTLKPE